MAFTNKRLIEAFLEGWADYSGETKRWSEFADARGTHLGAVMKDQSARVGPYAEHQDWLIPIGFRPAGEDVIYLDVETRVPRKGHRATLDRITNQATERHMRVVAVSADRLAELRGVNDGT